MVAAYQKAQSYADAGTVRLLAEAGGQKVVDETANYSLTLERPGKVRLQAYGAMLVCDGTKMYGSIEDQPGEVLVRDAPSRLTLQSLYADRVLAMALTQNFAGATPQVMLMLGPDPLKALLGEGGEPALAEPGKIDDRDCYRVQIRRPEGVTTLWIDQADSVLRRVVLPTDELRQYLSQQQPIDRISLVADFTGAKLDEKIDPKAFAFEVPEGAEIVKFFIPPELAYMKLLGKKSPDFKFIDPEGKPVTLESLAGKAVVLDFWATWCPPCKKGLPILQAAYEKFKDNPKVAYYAVSVDEPGIDTKDVAKTLEGLKVTIPMLRDPEKTAVAFRFQSIPTTFLLGPDGVVQGCEGGVNPQYIDELPAHIEKLLAGENVFEKPLQEFKDKLEKYAKMLETAAAGDATGAAGEGIVENREIPEVKIAERTEPAKFKLASAWKCDGVKSPGNLLVVRDKDGPVRLLAIEDWRSIAEIGSDGKLIAMHKLDIDENELIGNLRSGVGADGKRYFVAFLSTQQRCHVLDADWKLVTSYPEDALKHPHSGISDVEIGDLDGDGQLKLYISYWGAVGVQAASLEGKRLWSNRQFSNAISLAIGDPNDKGQRSAYCTDTAGAIIVLDSRGERQNELRIPDQMVQAIFAADLRGDGQLLWCGITAPKLGQNEAIGISTKGELLWQYAMPDGVQRQPIELVIPGKIVREGPGQWLLPGPDGSIHILSADGTLYDKFNFGAALQGLATIEIDGQPGLVVATEKGIEAFKAE